MSEARPSDPLLGYQFALDIGGKVAGYFSDVGGIGSESEVVEHKVVKDGKDFVQKIPGRLKWNDVTMRRGITDTLDMWEWRAMVESGELNKARTNCSLIMYDRNGEAKAQWDFVNAWPSRISGPEFKSDSNDFGVEELVIVHEGMKRVKV
jgi:phage tail-like protein